MSNRLEDNTLIDILCEVISTGLRKHFSVITKEGLFKEVRYLLLNYGSIFSAAPPPPHTRTLKEVGVGKRWGGVGARVHSM